MNSPVFDKLLSLPLFLGIGRADFMEIVARIRLGFNRKAENAVIVEEGSLCNSLFFIISGSFCSVQQSDARNYSFVEWYEAPMVLQPECLFGLTTRYTKLYRATSAVQYLEVDKRAISDILFTYPTFRFNYLNQLSMQVQQSKRKLWQKLPDSDIGKFIGFVANRCAYPAGRKEIRISMENLAGELQISRQRVSQMLRALENENLISLGRERIEIPALEKLLQCKRT